MIGHGLSLGVAMPRGWLSRLSQPIGLIPVSAATLFGGWSLCLVLFSPGVKLCGRVGASLPHSLDA